MRVLDFAELDAEQLVAQFAGELAGAAVGDGDIELLGLEATDRGDDGGGTASEHLGDFAGLDVLEQLVEGNHGLDYVVALVLQQLNQGATGHTRQNVTGQGFIEQGIPQSERLIKLNQIAIHQMSILETGDANDRKLLK